MAVSANAFFSTSRSGRHGRPRPLQWGWLAAVAGAHAAGLFALSGMGETPPPAVPAEPPALLVQFITPTEPSPPSPAPPPAPPVVRKAPEPPPPPPPRQERPRPPEPRPAPKPARKPAKAEAPRPEPPVAQHTPSEPPPTAATTDAPPMPPTAAPPPAPAASATAAPKPQAAAPPVVAARYDAAYLHNPHPAYPRLSRHRREEGQVVLRVHVLSNGRADTVEIAESSSHPRLDKAALEAVRDWRFVPARQGETAVDSWLRVPIVFRLEE